MAQKIELEIGETYAAQHQNLRDQLGEQYDQIMRETVEDKLHQLVKGIERNADQQTQMRQQNPETDLDDVTIESDDE